MTTTTNPETTTQSTSSNDTDQTFIEQMQVNPLATVARYYASCLATNPKAIAFVNDELHLTPDEAVERQLGFSDRTLGKHIPHRRLKRGRETRDLLISLGLYKANGREVMRGRVTEPILDASGNTIAIRGYKIDSHAAGPETILVGREHSQPPLVARACGQKTQTSVFADKTRRKLVGTVRSSVVSDASVARMWAEIDGKCSGLQGSRQ